MEEKEGRPSSYSLGRLTSIRCTSMGARSRTSFNLCRPKRINVDEWDGERELITTKKKKKKTHTHTYVKHK